MQLSKRNLGQRNHDRVSLIETPATYFGGVNE